MKASGLKREAGDDDGHQRFPSQRLASGMQDSAASGEPSSSSSYGAGGNDDDGFSSSSSSSSSGSDSSRSQGDDPEAPSGYGGKSSTRHLHRRLNPLTSPPLHQPGSVRSRSGFGAPDFQRLAMAQLGFSDAMLDEEEDKVTRAID